MSTFYLFRQYVKRVFRIPFLLAIVGTVFLYFASTWRDIISFPWHDVYYYLEYAQRYGIFMRLVYIFCAIPFAANYVRETIYQMRNYVIIRSTKKGYSWMQVVICAISGGLVLALGVALYILILCVKHPLYSDTSELVSATGYNSLLLANRVLGYYFCVVYLEFLKGALWAVVGLCLSSYITTIHIAIFSPIIVSYVYIELCKFLDIDNLFQITRLLSPQYQMENPYLALVIATLVTLVLILIFGFVFFRKVRISVAND